jgi:hypothetical protein
VAGWDRSDPKAAFINLLGIRDAPLDRETADRGAAIASRHAVSVADAHVGATAQLLPEAAGPVTIISSDAKAMHSVAESTAVVVVSL